MKRLCIYLAVIVLTAGPSLIAAETLDLVLRGGTVVDGTGAPWFAADVGIDDGKIVRIGHIAADEADVVIDAKGLIVAPGFIDMMGQKASPTVEAPQTATNVLTQGITTINAADGGSAAPLNDDEGLHNNGRVFYPGRIKRPAGERRADDRAYSGSPNGSRRRRTSPVR